jgi:glycerol-3-phosphate cytidylyltransferase
MEKKYRIGYTTGVFDLFHIGHLNLLRNAKERCSYLIVGISTDDVVESYKHKRPIVSFEERMEIVKAIRYVDEVVPQTSMDKVAAWEVLHYNALFHGDDWKGSTLYNDVERQLNARGVDTVFLPHTQGVSSTKLAEILQDLRSK